MRLYETKKFQNSKGSNQQSEKATHTLSVSSPSARVNIDVQLDEIWNQLRNTPVRRPMQALSGRIP